MTAFIALWTALSASLFVLIQQDLKRLRDERLQARQVVVHISIDTTAFVDAMRRASEATRDLQAQLRRVSAVMDRATLKAVEDAARSAHTFNNPKGSR